MIAENESSSGLVNNLRATTNIAITAAVSQSRTFDGPYDMHDTVSQAFTKAITDKAIVEHAADSGVGVGNGHAEAQIEFAGRHPAIAAGALVANPLREELMYRVAPEMLQRYFERRGKQGMATVVEIGSIAVFALAHMGSKPRLPITQAIAGHQYRKLYRERGLSHAVVAHTTNNLVGAGLALPEILKKRQELKRAR